MGACENPNFQKHFLSRKYLNQLFVASSSSKRKANYFFLSNRARGKLVQTFSFIEFHRKMIFINSISLEKIKLERIEFRLCSAVKKTREKHFPPPASPPTRARMEFYRKFDFFRLRKYFASPFAKCFCRVFFFIQREFSQNFLLQPLFTL